MTAGWSAVLDVWEADLAVRRQLAEAATPGPWEVVDFPRRDSHKRLKEAGEGRHGSMVMVACWVACFSRPTDVRGVLERHGETTQENR